MGIILVITSVSVLMNYDLLSDTRVEMWIVRESVCKGDPVLCMGVRSHSAR